MIAKLDFEFNETSQLHRADALPGIARRGTRGMNISDRRGFDTSGGQYFLPNFN